MRNITRIAATIAVALISVTATADTVDAVDIEGPGVGAVRVVEVA